MVSGKQAREVQLRELVTAIGVSISDIAILDQAFTHSSYANEHNLDHTSHYERLEFLGDAVLDLIIGEYLFLHYGEMTEGELTKIKASVVCESSLATCSRNLNLGAYLRLGKGELNSGGRNRTSILADLFESLVGTIYLTCSYEAAKVFVLNQLESFLELARSGRLGKDFKTLLQELVQHKGESHIFYRVVGESGPDHDKRFIMEVIVDGVSLGQGEGNSKKEAEQGAAKEALERLEQYGKA